jgi:membrane protease YdiL (CAAX protease family)
LKSKHQMGLFVLLLLCGVSLPSLSGLRVFPFSLIPSGQTLVYSVTLLFVFLVAAILLRSSKNLKNYWLIFWAFFIASLAIFFDLLVNVPSDTIEGLVFDMTLSTTVIVSTIILLTWVSGGTFSSIFLKKGNLKLSLILGLTGLAIFALTSPFVATALFQAQDLNVNKIISWVPWLLPIVLLNGMREELLYRGLFLKKFQTKFGFNTSNLLQAIIFSLSHSVAGVGLTTYTPYIWVLVVFTFILGLAWGCIMQRTDSILGSVLFHAGTDIPVFLGIFSSLF